MDIDLIDNKLYKATYITKDRKEQEKLWKEIRNNKEILKEAIKVTRNKMKQRDILKGMTIANNMLFDYKNVDKQIYNKLIDTIYKNKDIARLVMDGYSNGGYSFLLISLFNYDLKLTQSQKDFAVEEAMNKIGTKKYCKEQEIYSKSLEEKNITDGITYFPMLRKQNYKLFIGSLIEIYNDDLIERNKVIRPEYWLLLDINDYHLIELNKTTDKDYMDSSIIPQGKEYNNEFKEEQKELSKFSIAKNIQYREYILNDIQSEIVKSQKKITDSINDKLIVDDAEVSATEYLNSILVEEIESRVNDLVELIVTNKYSSIIYYYQQLIKEIIDEYITSNVINDKKMELASKILESYYGKYCGIKYFFNV